MWAKQQQATKAFVAVTSRQSVHKVIRYVNHHHRSWPLLANAAQLCQQHCQQCSLTTAERCSCHAYGRAQCCSSWSLTVTSNCAISAAEKGPCTLARPQATHQHTAEGTRHCCSGCLVGWVVMCKPHSARAAASCTPPAAAQPCYVAGQPSAWEHEALLLWLRDLHYPQNPEITVPHYI
jgi:hypothetical protein